MIDLFSYGSNSLAQLRGRIRSAPILDKSRPAFIIDHERIFFGAAGTWGEGGVASLKRNPGFQTYGSLINLSRTQLDELSHFEKGYKLEKVDCYDLQSNKNVEAYAYISLNTVFVNPPTLQYLSAIHYHLTEVDVPTQFPIIGYCKNNNRSIYHDNWSLPSSIYDLNLESFLVAVNIHRVNRGFDSWKMPLTMNQLTSVIKSQLNIHTVDDLIHICTHDACNVLQYDICHIHGLNEDTINIIQDIYSKQLI